MKNTYLQIFFFVGSIFLTVTEVSSQDFETLDSLRWGGVVEQNLDNSCGLASLLTIMQTHFGDYRYDEKSLLKACMENANEKSLLEAMKNGLSLFEIEKLAQSIGYTTKKKVVSLGELERLVSFVPVVVYLEVGKFRHFAVVRGVSKDLVFLGDSSRGNVEYSYNDFLSEWKTPKGYPKETGIAFVIVRKSDKSAQKLLREPVSEKPPSFIEMERQMTK